MRAKVRNKEIHKEEMQQGMHQQRKINFQASKKGRRNGDEMKGGRGGERTNEEIMKYRESRKKEEKERILKLTME